MNRLTSKFPENGIRDARAKMTPPLIKAAYPHQQPQTITPVQRDHLIGATVSALSLGALLLAFNGTGARTLQASAVPDGHTIIVMPRLPPEPPEQQIKDATEENSTVKPVAPLPSLPDVPEPTVDKPFIQPVELPPPLNTNPRRGAVTIPAGPWSGTNGLKGSVFRLDQLDRLPVARVQPRPIYPYGMRRNGVTGNVEVGFIVTAAGDVVDAYVIRSTNRAFEDPALQAVTHWKFSPGYRGGRPVNTRMSVRIVFDVRD